MNPSFFSSILNSNTPIIETITNSLNINCIKSTKNTSSLAKISQVPIAGTETNKTGNIDAMYRFLALCINIKAIYDESVPNTTSNNIIGLNKFAIAHPKTSPGINLLL